MKHPPHQQQQLREQKEKVERVNLVKSLIKTIKFIPFPNTLFPLSFYSTVISLIPVSVAAQTHLTQVLPSPSPTPKAEPLPQQEEIFPLQESPNEESEIPDLNVPRTITVEKFEVRDSTVFTPSELDQILAPFRDRALSYVELLEAQQAVTNLYLEQGYITSGAYVPTQSFSDK